MYSLWIFTTWTCLCITIQSVSRIPPKPQRSRSSPNHHFWKDNHHPDSYFHATVFLVSKGCAMRYYHSLTTGFFRSILCLQGLSLLHSHYYTAGVFSLGWIRPQGTCFGMCMWQYFGGPNWGAAAGIQWPEVMNLAEHFFLMHRRISHNKGLTALKLRRSAEKRSVFIPIPEKGNAKECSNYRTIAPHTLVK